MSDRLPLAIEELHDAESALATQLLRVADRHHADHEVHHVATDLAAWSREHVRILADVGRERGIDLAATVSDDPSLLSAARHKASDLLGSRHDVSVALIRDLRDIHRASAGVSLDWDVLAQTAQALQDRGVLAAAERCHPQTLRQMRWADAMVKEVSAQVLVSS